MEATLKKGVGLLLLVFIGYYLFTDPNGAAGAAKDVFGAVWDGLQEPVRGDDQLPQRPVRLTAVVAWFWRTFATPRISGRLLRHLDETLVEDVRHHWVVYVVPALIAVAGCWFLVLGFFVSVDAGWFCFLVGALLVLWAGLEGAATTHMDRFVVTNMRVFRVRGVFAESAATMPLARVLDITVRKTAARPAPRLRALRLRVRRAGAGAARHPVRAPARPARPDDPGAGAAGRAPRAHRRHGGARGRPARRLAAASLQSGRCIQ